MDSTQSPTTPDYMAYQKQTYGTPKRKRTAPQPAAGSPWMPNGQPMAAPPQPPAPAPQAAPAPVQQQAAPAAPAQAPGAPGPGWTPYGNGGWLPPGHPDAPVQQAAAPQPVQQTPQQSAAGVHGSVSQDGVYTAGQAPTATYNPINVPQFQAPQTPQVDAAQQQLVQQLLANPTTMTPEVVNQMKAAQRDQAVMQQQQQMGQLTGSLVGRGIDPNGSGMAAMLQRQLGANTNANLLSGNRTIDMAVPQQNRADQIQALGVGNDFQNSNLQRAVTGYGANLSGATAQGQQQQAYLDSVLKNYTTGEGMLGNQASTLQQAIAQKQGNAVQQGQLANQANQIGNQNSQFGQSLNFDQSKFAYQKQQDAAQLAAQQAANSTANSHWLDSMALNYDQLNNSSGQSLFDFLMGGGS